MQPCRREEGYWAIQQNATQLGRNQIPIYGKCGQNIRHNGVSSVGKSFSCLPRETYANSTLLTQDCRKHQGVQNQLQKRDFLYEWVCKMLLNWTTRLNCSKDETIVSNNLKDPTTQCKQYLNANVIKGEGPRRFGYTRLGESLEA